jgi:glucuronate isomerase
VQASPLAADRFLPADPATRRIARGLYERVAGLPLVSPHGHVDPLLLADPSASFGSPAELFVMPDHYVFRMLHSQGIPLEALGLRSRPPGSGPDGGARRGGGLRGESPSGGPSVETDHRRVWQIFADNQHLFRATPTGAWLAQELVDVFGIDEPLGGANAMAIYDAIEARLAQREFRPRALFERFRIETLCTTDDAADSLEAHREIRASGWSGDVRPTFRPDGVVNLLAPDWRARLEALSRAVGRQISTTAGLIAALEERRAFFREHGAVATDHGVETAYTGLLAPAEADAILGRALRGTASADDAQRFGGHMLIELARMSAEDNLVMQLHVGSLRNHDTALFDRFGPDLGADIPVAAEFTRNLRPLLERFGDDTRLRLIVFTLDESCYSRELAPLAGHYAALRLGPPWWFLDSPNGIARYLDAVVETAGLANLAGFNDDTRAFCSIPARHDVWRRATAGWLASLVARHVMDEATAAEMAADLATNLARRAYRLDGGRDDGPRPPRRGAEGAP